MIQVIQHGNKKRIVCPDCSCIFTYQKEDVGHKQTGVNEFECFVRCPDCGKDGDVIYIEGRAYYVHIMKKIVKEIKK